MDSENEEYTAFVTNKGTYCYKVISFSPKNVRTTYQCLVNKIFKDQIGRNMQVYVDNMLVKSNEEADHIIDLEEAFDNLHLQIKLNPSKCTFGIIAEKFLSFMVTRCGIEMNPEKIQAIIDETSNFQEGPVANQPGDRPQSLHLSLD